HRLRTHPPRGKHLHQNDSVRLIVVHDENGTSLKKGGILQRIDLAILLDAPEPYRKMKRTAAARLAFKPNLAAHQLHQPLRNRETEARSAVLPRRRAVRLREGLENQRLFFLRNTNTGIAHLEMNR